MGKMRREYDFRRERRGVSKGPPGSVHAYLDRYNKEKLLPHYKAKGMMLICYCGPFLHSVGHL